MERPEPHEVSIRQAEYVKSLETALVAAHERITELEAAWARGEPAPRGFRRFGVVWREPRGQWHHRLDVEGRHYPEGALVLDVYVSEASFQKTRS